MARRQSYKTKIKRSISRATGIPTTKSGRKAKARRIMTGGGCLLPILATLAAVGAVIAVLM